MTDLASLSADQLAEKALRGYGFPVGGPTQEKAEAGVAELQTRANRAQAAEKERDEEKVRHRGARIDANGYKARWEAAEARLAETQKVLEEYGGHTIACLRTGTVCSCGFDAARAALTTHPADD